MAKGTCSIGACEGEHLARGWCGAHYERWRRYGDPLGEISEPADFSHVPVGRPHRLSDRNEETQTALCAVCGPVQIRWCPKGAAGYWRCLIGFQASRWRDNVRQKELRAAGRPPRAGAAARVLRRRLRRYGLTVDAYDDLVKRYGGRCGICRKSAELHIDHDHKTGKIRGLLCGSCNRGIGLFGDSPIQLRAAILYLSAA